jgi:hypothetical protein
VRVVQHDAGAPRSNDLARRCDEMTTAFRFANVSGRVHHALSAREARANPLTSSGLKSAHRTRTLKPDGGPSPTTKAVSAAVLGVGHRSSLAQLRPSKSAPWGLAHPVPENPVAKSVAKPRPMRKVLVDACGGFVVERQLLTSLKVSNFDREQF